MIAQYPDFSDILLEDRTVLHPHFLKVNSGISEFTFANIFLFRKTHAYKIAQITSGLFVISGADHGESFFMLPFGIPEQMILNELFKRFGSLKNASEAQAQKLQSLGYFIQADRNHFDYLYNREQLATLVGRKFSKKRNHLKKFKENYNFEARPLLEEYAEDALLVLQNWCLEHANEGDCAPAREALGEMESLQLCGGIYYIDEKPVGYTLGEEITLGTTYVIHFEKALSGYNGLYQFINQSFAALLPEQYVYINREQDLGDEGLRQAKMSYRPVDFIKKYRVQSNPFSDQHNRADEELP